MIVSGGRDLSVSKAVLKKMHKAAPRASFINLPRACHAGMIGERVAVLDGLDKFLKLQVHLNRDFNRARLAEHGMVSAPDTPHKDPYGQAHRVD